MAESHMRGTTVRRVLVVLAAITAALALMVTPAAAAGGNGASACSHAAGPATSPGPDNPGEAASFFAQIVGFNGQFNPGHIPGPGGKPITAGVCNPNTNP